MIVKRGKKYLVKSSDGKQTLGTHDNEGDAQAQLSAIEFAQKGREEDAKGNPKKGYFVSK